MFYLDFSKKLAASLVLILLLMLVSKSFASVGLACVGLFKSSLSDTQTNLNQTADLSAQQKSEVLELFKKGQWQEASLLALSYQNLRWYRFIQSRIKHELLNGKIESVLPFVNGIESSTEVYIVTFTSGLKAIYKPDPQFWKDYTKRTTVHSQRSNSVFEEFAYFVSEEFALNIVPAVILRSIEDPILGPSHGSLQVYFENERPDPFANDYAKRQQIYTSSKSYSAVKILDYLLQNYDRHKDNILYSTTSPIVVAIDHGLILNTSPKSEYPPPTLSDLLSDPNFYALDINLKKNLYLKLNSTDFINSLSKYLKPKQIAEFLERLRKFSQVL